MIEIGIHVQPNFPQKSTFKNGLHNKSANARKQTKSA